MAHSVATVAAAVFQPLSPCVEVERLARVELYVNSTQAALVAVNTGEISLPGDTRPQS